MTARRTESRPAPGRVTLWTYVSYPEGGLQIRATIDGAPHHVFAHPHARRAPAAANCHTCGHSAVCVGALLALEQIRTGRPPALAVSGQRP